MSISIALLVICLVIVSYTLGFVSGTSSQWKDETEKDIHGLKAMIEKRGKQIETQTREIEVLTADLNATKNACLTSFEDIGNRLNKMSDILVNLLHAEGSQGEMAHATSAEAVPAYSLLDMVDKKEEESYDE